MLVEMVFNGEYFMLHFYDKKTGYEYAVYDKTGKMKGSKKINKNEISQWDIQRVEANLVSNTENISIFPNGNQGFIRSTFTKNKKTGYEIVGYDNKAKELWKVSSAPNSTKFEFVEIEDVNSEFLIATVSKKKSIMTREFEMFGLLINTKTGKLIREFELGNKNEGLHSLLKSHINLENESIMLIGEYFKPKDDIVKNKSEGLYIQEISLTGFEKDIFKYKWKGDIDKFKAEIGADDKKDNRANVFFHDVIIDKKGSLLLIGELFSKQVSAGGVALKALSGGSGSGVSAVEIRLGNMVIFEFDKEKNLVDFKSIKKKPTSVLLPEGMGMYGSSTIGLYIKAMGDFDYRFTSSDKENDKFDVVYIDADRKETKESSKADIMIGVISLYNSEFSNNRVPINCTAKIWWIQPGKPGTISVSEYFSKEKRIDMRIEQLTY